MQLVLDAGLGEISTHMHTWGSDAAEVAWDACGTRHVCAMRRVHPGRVAAMVQRKLDDAVGRRNGKQAIQLNVSLFNLKALLGSRPAGHRVDLRHLDVCTSCEGGQNAVAMLKTPAMTLVQGHKVLLVDNMAIQAEHGTLRVFSTMRKHKVPVITADRPWEIAIHRPAVLHDGHKFRMWYRCFKKGLAYAESNDGVTFVKPELNLFNVTHQFLLYRQRGERSRHLDISAVSHKATSTSAHKARCGGAGDKDGALV